MRGGPFIGRRRAEERWCSLTLARKDRRDGTRRCGSTGTAPTVRLKFIVPLLSRPRHSPSRAFSVGWGWIRNAGHGMAVHWTKMGFGGRGCNGFLFRRNPNLFGNAFGDVNGDALNLSRV
jgi:hypothetical protein